MIHLIFVAIFGLSFGSGLCEIYEIKNINQCDDCKGDDIEHDSCSMTVCLQKLNQYKECKEEQKNTCKSLEEDAKKILSACSNMGFKYNTNKKETCNERLSFCQKCQHDPNAKGCDTKCSMLVAKSKEDLEKALEEQKDKAEETGDKIENLEKEIAGKQKDALDKKQKLEEEMAEIQQKLDQIPQKMKKMTLDAEANQKKEILDHMSNIDATIDKINSLHNKTKQVDRALETAQMKLLDECETRAREFQAEIRKRQNQQRQRRQNFVNSLQQAMATTQKTNCTINGKTSINRLRSACLIEQKFVQCQSGRQYQERLKAAKREYYNNLDQIAAEKSMEERKLKGLERRLKTSIELQNRALKLQMEQLQQEQQNLAQQLLMKQRQMQEQMQFDQQQQYEDQAKLNELRTKSQVETMGAVSIFDIRKKDKIDPKRGLSEDSLQAIVEAIGLTAQFDNDDRTCEDSRSIKAITTPAKGWR